MFETSDDVNILLREDLNLDSIAKSGYQKITNNANAFSDRVGELLRNLDSK